MITDMDGRLRVCRFFCNSDEPKTGLARDLGDRLQSRNVPFETYDDCNKTESG